MRGQGRYFGNNANTIRIAGYALVDAQASWRLKQGDLILRRDRELSATRSARGPVYRSGSANAKRALAPPKSTYCRPSSS